MIQLQLFPYELAFKHAFGISRHVKTSQSTLVVKLETEGFYGLGETTANTYYHMTIPRLMEDLKKIEPLLNQMVFTHPEELWEQLSVPLAHNPFALCAIDQAAWDIYAKQKHKKLYEVWGLDIANNPLTDYTIGIDRIENMVKKLKEFPWPIYKIKLGTSQDLEIVRALRQETSAVFRVDANAAWNLQQTLEYSEVLKDLGVEFIEQPLPDPQSERDWEDHQKAYEQAALPLIADESCIVETDVEKCEGYFHGINIKLVKCGGLTPALRMIKKARKLGMKLMLGSMNESTTGSSAAAHLLPYLDYIDLDGPLLQAEDTATGIGFENGKIIYAERYGTGARLLNSYSFSE